MTFPNIDWDLADKNGDIGTWERVQIAVLMDVRRELQTLNRLLACPNFISIPATLRQIQQNTEQNKRKVRKAR